MKVMVIPEDFRKDQFIVKPLVAAVFKYIGRNAKIRVCQNPLLGGVGQALKWERVKEIIGLYPMVDLFLLLIDRDGVGGRKHQLKALEAKARADLRVMLIGENAHQEIEVWVLAGHALPKAWNWDDVRGHADPKDAYFVPFARLRRVFDGPGDGREVLAAEAFDRYGRVRQRCSELRDLEQRILSLCGGPLPGP